MTDAVLCELHALRDRIDRACRVVQALSVGLVDMVTWGTNLEKERQELDCAMYDIMEGRARERELMAQPADAEPKCSHGISRLANCADCLDAAHAEGIAQGRRVLAREAFARYYRPDAIFGSPGEMVSDLKGWLEGIAK